MAWWCQSCNIPCVQCGSSRHRKRRLEGFYARCLRRILRIPAAFVSRVSNKVVFQRAGVQPFTEQLLYRQLLLLGKVARSPETNPLREDVFVGDTLRPQVGRCVRRVGRPRQDWTTQVLSAGAAKFGSATRFETLLRDRGDHAEQNWKRELRRVFYN